MGLLRRAEPDPNRKQETSELDLNQLIQRRALEVLRAEAGFDPAQEHDLRLKTHVAVQAVLESQQIKIGDDQREAIVEGILDDLVGYSKLGPLLRDANVQAITIVGPDRVYVKRGGSTEPADLIFPDTATLNAFAQRLLADAGESADEQVPISHFPLADTDWQVHLILPPAAPDGPVITLRRLGEADLPSPGDLLRVGTLSEAALHFLRACVLAGLNILITGERQSGKTALLNALAQCIPPEEQIVTIERRPELRLPQPRTIRLLSQPPRTGKQLIEVELDGDRVVQLRQRAHCAEEGVTVETLLNNAPYLNPDRILLGELRREEALTFINLLHAGHSNAIATLHSTGPADALRRLVLLCTLSGLDLPTPAIREQVSTALHIIVHMKRHKDGVHRVAAVVEVNRWETDAAPITTLFERMIDEHTPRSAAGELRPTGTRPRHIGHIAAAGVELPPSLFGLD